MFRMTVSAESGSGSVGLAFDYHLSKESFHADLWAEYAIFSYNEGFSAFEFRRTYYDLSELIRVIQTSGRPHAAKAVGDYLPK